MVLIELPLVWIIILNVAGWPVIHLLVAWGGTRLPIDLFHPDQWWCKARWFERDGRFYERVFAIRRWKDKLPDGAALFQGGFRKKHLNARDPHYLYAFVRETCRGEAVHWFVFFCAGIFFLWNVWWVGLIMVAYAAVANVPCILAQRYNRIRLMRLVERL